MINWIHQRVTRRRPCELCGRDSYCSYDPLHGAIFCTKIESQWRMGDWGWRHMTDPRPEEYDASFAIDGEREPLPELDEDERTARTAVYYTMQAIAGLSDDDHLYLLGRGIREDEIQQARYFTLPPRTHTPVLVAELQRQTRMMSPICGIPAEAALFRIPGFKIEGRNDLRLVSPLNGGIAIPVCDAGGYTVGLRLRARDEDVDAGASRYSWISSPLNRSGAPCHVVKPDVMRRNAILITEGEFKAQIAAHRMGVIAISVPGVDAQRALVSTLDGLRRLGHLDDQSAIILAFDQDASATTRANVQRALARLRATAARQTQTLLIAWWRPAFKGIDDALTADEQVHLAVAINEQQHERSNAWTAKASFSTGRTKSRTTTGRTASTASASRAGSISTRWRTI